MEFLVVSKSKLKIMMSSDDMKKYGIDGENIDYDNPKIRRSFWKILDEAKESCGFEAAGDKVLIQYYPSKDGSEIFVTKLGLISKNAERTISKSNMVTMLGTKIAIYKIESFHSLAMAVKIINGWERESDPRIYLDDRGIYYLVVDEKACLTRASELSRLLEFGSEVPTTLFSYIEEHSRKIEFKEI